MFVPPNRYFEAQRPLQTVKPAIDNDDNLKKAFGVELAKGFKAFDAACNICGDSTANAVWVSLNWIGDPIALASRDLYLKTVELDTPLLDKDQFAARLLQISEEKDEQSGRYLIDAKDRLKALELYAEVMKFTGGDDNTSKTFIHNSMVVKFVEPEKKEIKTIDETVEETSDIVPLKLKLVG